jgi:tripartite-type tricarboxylate transporter receptor subunit TctC
LIRFALPVPQAFCVPTTIERKLIMLTRRKVLINTAGASVAMTAASASLAQQAELSNPIRIVVGYPPGGASDRAARLIGERLQAKLNNPVIVENRAGAGGRLAAQQLVKTPGSQTVLMIGNPAVMTVAPLVSANIGYDPDVDFVPLAHATEYEFGLAVGAALPLTQVSHVLAWIRANPEKANIGVPATGSLPHFFALMLGFMTSTKVAAIGYRGSAPMVTDLIGGQIPMSIDTLDSLIPQHEAGKIRIVATSGVNRSFLLPKVNSFKEAGLPIIATGWNVMYAPATMPKATQAVLSKALFEVMSEPALQQSFRAGKMSPVAMNQVQTAAMLKKFNEQWRPVIRRSGFTSTS